MVDFICHSIKSIFNALATSIAKSVFPVPGSPLTNNGLSKDLAALTAMLKSSVDI